MTTDNNELHSPCRLGCSVEIGKAIPCKVPGDTQCTMSWFKSLSDEEQESFIQHVTYQEPHDIQ